MLCATCIKLLGITPSLVDKLISPPKLIPCQVHGPLLSVRSLVQCHRSFPGMFGTMLGQDYRGQSPKL